MLVAILVATPHAAFGELVRLSLEDSGQYQVRLVMSAREVRVLAEKSNFQLAILDSALPDEPLSQLCADLVEIQKGIRLIIIPPENNPNHPLLGGLLPHGYLNRPFYLPDMLDTVSRLLNQSSAEQEQPIPDQVSSPDFPQEQQRLLHPLETELASTQAIEGIIGSYGDGSGARTLCFQTGRLAEAAVQEVANVVFRYWNHDEKTDLMRFIRLGSDKKDYLIYATQLVGERVLILVFDSSAPLSHIRPQTKKIAQTLVPLLANQPAAGSDTLPEISVSAHEQRADTGQTAVPGVSSIMESEGATRTDEQEQPLPDIWEQPPGIDNPYLHAWQTDDSSPPASNNLPLGFHQKGPSFDTDELDPYDNGQEEQMINLSALLGSVPSPDPVHEPFNGDWSTEPSRFFPTEKNQNEINGNRSQNKQYPDNQAGENTLREEPVEQTEEDPNAPTTPVVLRPVTKTPAFDLNLAVEEEIDSLEDTRPHIVAALTNLSQLEPASAALSKLNYTCVLIPRLPQHYLTGNLTEQLAQWVQQFCLAFGWRLEAIAIRPEYLQWTVQVSPSISPGNMIRIVRQRTSLNIFEQFPHYGEHNPSGDFWATGYLIVSGAQPPSTHLLRDYITQTRKRQGIIK